VAVDAPTVSYVLNFEPAAEVGLTVEDTQGLLVAVAPIVGTARVASAAGKLTDALGFVIDLAIAEAELEVEAELEAEAELDAELDAESDAGPEDRPAARWPLRRTSCSGSRRRGAIAVIVIAEGRAVLSQ
jgi:hypothetical protein